MSTTLAPSRHDGVEGAPPRLAPRESVTAQRRPSAPPSSRIRGLDGLRALAVLAVVVYHVRPDLLPGGFLGVDVFFVVSGFLITTLLLREVRMAGRLDLRRFWLRRARRLLPALAVVVAVSVLLARLAEPDLLVGIGTQVLGAATFSSNWLAVAAEASYFDATSPQLFATFWSLAIEEQFYLVWPVALAVLLAVVRTWRMRAVVAGGAALASAGAMAALYAPGADPTRVYYGTDTHVAGLLMGVAAAFWWAGRSGHEKHRVPRPLRLLAPAAVVALVVTMVLLHSDAAFTYRGGIAVGSALAVVTVLGCAAGQSRYVSVLESRPLVWVGERSYGIYLWHWPVLLVVAAAADAALGSAAWWATTALALVATFGLAAVSYRWVETPIRRDGFRVTAARARAALRQPAPRVAAAVMSLAVVAAGLAVATAPRVSGAQASVEAGLAAIEDSSSAPPVEPSNEPTAASSTPAPEETDGAAPAPSAPAVTGEQISAFGDSVLSGAAPAVLNRFPGIALDAEPIRKWVDAPALVQAALDAGTVRDVVVLNFGTNGGFQFDGSEDAMRQVLDSLGPDRRVVLVNTVGVSYWVPDANARLAAIAGEYPNAVVADWHAAVADRPELLHADHTHPTMAGIEVYADVIQAALAGLPPAPDE